LVESVVIGARNPFVGGRIAIALLATSLALAAAPAAAAVEKPPQLEARSWVLMEAESGRVLASHAASQRLPIASTTKMMTAYVALQELPLEKTVRAASYDAIYGESLLELRPGQLVSVRDLLYGLILRSGNDSAHDLARAAAGSDRRFVRQMNRRAAALGLSDTHYSNPIGLDEAGNYSSAYDLAVLGRRLLDIRAFATIADSRTAILRSLHPPKGIETLNDLLHRAPWTTGIKTGHTFDAAYVLVGSGERKGVDLISAVLGTQTETARDLESLELLEYGFSLYRKRKLVRKGEAMARPPIRYDDGVLPLRAPRAVTVGVRRGQRARVSVRAPREVEGPIRRGAVIGRATVRVGGSRVATVPLRAGRGVPEASALDKARSFIADNALWLALALSGILVGAVVLRRLTR
jgi:serine-type D-Ala-D-Ala carboxypeptidase (penicillin-binding protein 5/6)